MPSSHSHESEHRIFRTKTTCPQCHKEADMIQLREMVPLFGEVLLNTLNCSHCSLKLSDVMSLTFGKPTGFEAKINHEEDLSIKIVRNSNATVEIPELGVLLEPGPFSEGFYTNMEGLLERVEHVLTQLIHDSHGKEKETAQKIEGELVQCKEGKKPFTVRVLDPMGGSALIGKNVKQFDLSEEEAAALKKGINY